MYFSRYIWNFIQKIYLKKKLRRSFVYRIQEFPLVTIPRLFYYKYRKRLKKKIKKKIIYLKKINKKNLNLQKINIYINNNFKYKYNYIYIYLIKFNLIYFLKKYKKKYKYNKKKIFLKLHTGKKYRSFKLERLNNFKITLAILTETITYGFKKQKKKQQKKKQQKKVASSKKIIKKKK